VCSLGNITLDPILQLHAHCKNHVVKQGRRGVTDCASSVTAFKKGIKQTPTVPFARYRVFDMTHTAEETLSPTIPIYFCKCIHFPRNMCTLSLPINGCHSWLHPLFQLSEAMSHCTLLKCSSSQEAYRRATVPQPPLLRAAPLKQLLEFGGVHTDSKAKVMVLLFSFSK
jgi:hypothetical protein